MTRRVGHTELWFGYVGQDVVENEFPTDSCPVLVYFVWSGCWCLSFWVFVTLCRLVCVRVCAHVLVSVLCVRVRAPVVCAVVACRLQICCVSVARSCFPRYVLPAASCL